MPKNETGPDEPPPLIKQVIWLLNPQNWRRYWPAIVVALVVWLLSWIFVHWLKGPSTPQPTTATHQTTDRPESYKKSEAQQVTTQHSTRYAHLSEDTRRAMITKELRHGDVRTVLAVLATLPDTAQREECSRAFESYLRGSRLDDAELVVEWCQKLCDEAERNEKLRRLEYERLKQGGKE